MQGLKGLRTLVTGAAGGIGSEVVERLRAEGAVIAATDIVEPEFDGVEFAAASDVTDEDSVTATVNAAADALGGVDALVATVGIHAASATHELDLAKFRKVLDVNVVGTFLTVRAVLPFMLSSGQGRIVTFGSTAAVTAAPGLAAYAAAKGAILQFTRSVAVEYAGRGIRANCLCPGGTRTRLMADVDNQRQGDDHFLRDHPIGRYAEPREIAAAVAFLLSDESSFVLGSAFMADGGYTAH